MYCLGYIIDVCCLCCWIAMTLLAHVVLPGGTLICAAVWVSFMLDGFTGGCGGWGLSNS